MFLKTFKIKDDQFKNPTVNASRKIQDHDASVNVFFCTPTLKVLFT